MASFFRKFVPKFSEYAVPLFDLLKKNVTFVWSDECDKGFNYIKNQLELEKPTLLAHPQFDKPFIIQSDASAKSVGFLLAQVQDGHLRPVMFGGRVLTDAERRYATLDRELLGILYALKKCEIYVLGHDFLMYTDHRPLTRLKSFKDVVHRCFRWIQYLENMQAKLCYLPGSENVVSDFISRNIKEEKPMNVVASCLLDLSAVSYDHDDLIAAQMNDPELFKVISFLNGKCENTPQKFRRYKCELSMDKG